MSFGARLKERREALGLSRAELAERLGLSRSAIGNYEIGVSFPKEEVLLQLFHVLQAEPNELFYDSFHADCSISTEDRLLIERYRRLSPAGQGAVQSLLHALRELPPPETTKRVIPLYTSPAAAGYVSPVMGEDFEPFAVTKDTPREAEFAVRIRGDSMEPYIADGSIAFAHHAPIVNGDIGIFCVDGDMFCKQYYRDPLGMVYLFSLNRRRADADVLFYQESGRNLFCFGRVILPQRVPLPGM